jgi:hypothetical protein
MHAIHADALPDLIAAFRPISLDELDRRASLQQRVDHKYVAGLDRLADMLESLRADHDALEIDGRRAFDYRSVYFDTPERTSFVDHVEGRKPRYKVRTRHYLTTRACVFEVKIKRPDGETSKRSIDYDGTEQDRLTEDARALIDEELGAAGLEPPGELHPSLVTEFSRVTLGLRDGPERVTIDRDLRLGSGDESLVLRPDLALVETKTEDGAGRSDRALAELGVEPVSLSKYRIGIGRLAAPEADADYAQPLAYAFERRGGDRGEWPLLSARFRLG